MFLINGYIFSLSTINSDHKMSNDKIKTFKLGGFNLDASLSWEALGGDDWHLSVLLVHENCPERQHDGIRHMPITLADIKDAMEYFKFEKAEVGPYTFDELAEVVVWLKATAKATFPSSSAYGAYYGE